MNNNQLDKFDHIKHIQGAINIIWDLQKQTTWWSLITTLVALSLTAIYFYVLTHPILLGIILMYAGGVLALIKYKYYILNRTSKKLIDHQYKIFEKYHGSQNQ